MTRLQLALLTAAVVLTGGFVGFALGSATGGGGSADAVATPTTSPTSVADAGLAARLPTAVFDGCAPVEADRPTVRCTSPKPGVDELLVSQWPDAAAMRADFTSHYGSKPDGKCGQYTGEPTSGLRSTWGGQQPLACYRNSKGAAVVLWEYVGSAVQVIAIRTDGDAKAAFVWWIDAVKTPLD